MLDDLKSRSGCSTEADNVGGEQASEEKVCSCFCSRKNYMPEPFSKKPGDKIPRRIFKKIFIESAAQPQVCFTPNKE